jgi:formate dehydrogenase subunit gamma
VLAVKHTKKHFIQRWNLQHRLQHGTLALSMFGLLISGLAMKYHAAGWSQWTFGVLGGFHNTLILHKLSASVLVAVSAWHLAYLLFHWDSNWRGWSMMPTLKDVTDVWEHMLFLLQIRKEAPRFDRYSYLEKFEYLAIFWGMVVMGMTGFSLWFPAGAATFVPRYVLDAFRLVHGNEAVVAAITLIYGHFFNAHFNPGVFPSSQVWLTGNIPLEHMLEEHPEEYVRLVADGREPAVAIGADHHAHTLPAWRRWLAGFELIIYSAIFYYLLITFLPKLLA